MPEFPASGPISATVRIASGALRIAAEPRDTVTIDVQPGSNSEASRQAAAETLVDMSGDQLTVETPQARGFILRRGGPVNISIRVPRDSRLTLRSASADINCDGRFGDSDINLASGDLTIEQVAGDLRLSTASGDARFARVDGALTAGTASGDIRGHSVGGDMSAKTASGDVTVEAVAGSVGVSTASGDIEVGNVAAGSVRMHTASGDVVVGVAEGTPIWLDLNTLSGDTRTDLPVSGETPAGTTAALTMYIRTVSGDITVRRSATAPATPSPVPSRTARAQDDSEPRD